MYCFCYFSVFVKISAVSINYHTSCIDINCILYLFSANHGRPGSVMYFVSVVSVSGCTSKRPKPEN